MKRILSFLLSISIIITLISGLTVSAAEADWTSGIKYSVGVGRSENGKLIMDMTNSTETEIAQKQLPSVNAANYDVSWNMSYTNGGSVVFYLKGHRYYTSFYSDRMTYTNVTGSTSTIYYPFGTGTHNIRLVGNDAGGDLYIDGYFVSNLQIVAYGTGASAVQIHFACGGGGIMVVSDFKAGTPSSSSSQSSGSTLPGTEEDPNLKIEDVYYDFEDPSQLNDWVSEAEYTNGAWEVADGVLRSAAEFSTPGQTSGVESKTILRSTGFADDFVLTAKMRYTTANWTARFEFFGNNRTALVYKNPDNWQVYLDRSRYVIVTSPQPPNEWMDLRIESYNNSSTGKFFVNNKLITEFTFLIGEIPPYTAGNVLRIEHRVNYRVAKSTIEFDEFSFKPIYNNLILTGIKDGDAFLEGTDIKLGVETKNNVNPEKVEYYLNGIKAQEGTAPGYETVLKDLPPGKYEIQAKCDGEQSIVQTFTIERAIKGDVNIQKISSGNYALTTDLKDRIDQVASVEYFVDGLSVGKSSVRPFKVNVPLTNENHTITAIFKNANGHKLGETNRTFIPALGANEASQNFSNEVRYTVSGTSGNAVYDFSNGTHRLYLKHSADKVTYLTDKGEETYNYGTGEFVISTNGTFADVYRNGQFAFSFYMPKATSSYKNISQSGLRISNESLTILEDRRNYFADKNVSAGNHTYNVPDMPIVYNVDFMAKKTDNLNLVVNDGHFRTDLTIEDGKVYAWYCKNNKTIPEKWHVGDVPNTDGYIAYRLETSAGMSQLLADGRWIATIRSPRSVGGKNITYKIPAGSSLKYISVRDYNDTYTYYDNFDGAGEFASKDYWHGNMNIKESLGVMLLNAGAGAEAYGEFMAYAGSAEFSADITAEALNDGLWFITDRGVTKSYTVIGYNAADGVFEAYNYLNGTIEAKVTAEGELPIGRKFNMTVKQVQNGAVKNIVLYVDGNPVLAFDKTRFMRGTLGIMVKNGDCTVDRVAYRGDTRPLRGTNGRGAVNVNPTLSAIDVNGEIHASGGTSVYISKDMDTFTQSAQTVYRGYNQLQLLDENGEPSNEVLVLQSYATGEFDEQGRKLSNYRVYYSSDYLQSSVAVADLFPEPRPNINMMANRFHQGISGRIYAPVGYDIYTENDGKARVYYSDDKGLTWKASETELDTAKLGHLIQECEVIELKDGTVRFYSRTELGTVVYYESKDRGVTFDLTRKYLAPFLMAGCTFNIIRDPYDPDTIYASWQMDNANLDASNQLPRTLWCLARSTDEGETWEYCGTVHANINPTENNSQNYTMTVLKDYLLFSGYSDDTYISNSQIGRAILVEKSKIQGTKNFEPMYMLTPTTIERAATLSNSDKEAVFVIHPESGNVIKGGERWADSAVNEHVSVDLAAEFSGTKVVLNADGSVSLKLGTTIENKFDASSVVKHNGKTYISIREFAERFGLVVGEKDGIYVIYTSNAWDDIHWATFKYAVDLLSGEI